MTDPIQNDSGPPQGPARDQRTRSGMARKLLDAALAEQPQEAR
jgi:hypothetical protein